MVVATKESGRIIIWKEWEYTSGTMAESMKANIKMIKSTGSEFTSGQMEDYTKVSGGKENSTALELT